jgi:hypothetical protein
MGGVVKATTKKQITRDDGESCCRCSECEDLPHHFIDDYEEDAEHEFACKHCETTANMCDGDNCDSSGAVWPPHDSGLCESCRNVEADGGGQ